MKPIDTPVKLLLGCGDEVRMGWVHHDREKHSQHVDVAHDLEVRPWPFPSNAAARIVALDVLEHLWDTVAFFDECHRILQPGGYLKVRVPHWQGENAWKDPTHRRAFHPEVFSYFDPETNWGTMFGKFYTKLVWRLVYVFEDGERIEAELAKG